MQKRSGRDILKVDHEVHMTLRGLFPDYNFPVSLTGLPFLVAMSTIGDHEGYQRFSHERYPSDIQRWMLWVWVAGMSARQYFLGKGAIAERGGIYFLMMDPADELDDRGASELVRIEVLLQILDASVAENKSQTSMWA